MFLTVPGREYLTERALNGSLGKLENRRDISTGAKRKIWTLSHSSCAWWSPLQPYHPSSHLHRTLFQNFPHLAYCCLSSSLISLRFKATMEEQVGATSGGGTDAAAAHRCCRRPVARRRWRAALPLPWRVAVGSLRRGGVDRSQRAGAALALTLLLLKDVLGSSSRTWLWRQQDP
jgi:hypothetical protein